jgi:hypothetical protein
LHLPQAFAATLPGAAAATARAAGRRTFLAGRGEGRDATIRRAEDGLTSTRFTARASGGAPAVAAAATGTYPARHAEIARRAGAITRAGLAGQASANLAGRTDTTLAIDANTGHAIDANARRLAIDANAGLAGRARGCETRLRPAAAAMQQLADQLRRGHDVAH